jgi:hypothetical protein
MNLYAEEDGAKHGRLSQIDDGVAAQMLSSRRIRLMRLITWEFHSSRMPEGRSVRLGAQLIWGEIWESK